MSYPPRGNGNGNGNGGQGQQSEVLLRLPEKIGRGNLVQNMHQFGIFVNGYNMDLSNAASKVYKCELKFIGTNKKGEDKDLSRGQKNDVANILRHEMLFDLYCTMLRGNENNFGNVQGDRIYNYAYDCGVNFYSLNRVVNRQQKLELKIDMSKIKDKSKNYISRNIVKITAVLYGTEEIDLKSSSSVAQELEQRDRSMVQFLEILTNQLLYHQESYFVYAQKLFSKDPRNNITVEGGPKVIKSGMSKSVRFIGDNQQSSAPLVQIDPKKSLFFKATHLGRYIMEFFNCADKDIAQILTRENERRRLIKELKNLVVETTHQPKNSFFNIHSITTQNSNELTFEDRDGNRISISQYFERKYHMRLRFANLPCIVEKKVAKVDGQNQTKESYYPIEVLKIVDGQRVSLQKMTPKLTEQMIRNCQAKPVQYKQDIEQQRANAMLQSGGAPFRAFGIRINADIRTAQAEIMYPPSIGYSNGTTELPVRDRDGNNDVAWMVSGMKFWRSLQDCKVWVAVLFQQGIPGNDTITFLGGLVNTAQQLGMNFPKASHQEAINSTDIETIRQRMNFFKSNGAKFVMFFTRDKLDPVHHTMKFLEIETRVVTQHICKSTVDKAISGRGAQLVYNNILQKTNLKLGGINWSLGTTRALIGRNPNLGGKNIVVLEWLKQSRMFIGIDLSHAGPQSLFERQSGVLQSEPTIVGMACTMGHPLYMKGTYWCQPPRNTIIEDLADKIVEALNIYSSERENGGKFPQHLVVYRGGVSEGDYAKVITKEQDYFQQAFTTIKRTHPEFRDPLLTIVIVQKTSNYRIIPQGNNDDRAPAVRQNVQAGTVVDRGIMHPTQTEFLLVPHKAIQGTAHPIKCVLAFDNCMEKGQQRMSLEELEHVTYYLCYAHGIVNSPVSVPAPLYSAGDLAKRGRNNWTQFNYGDDSESSVSSEGGRHRNTGQPNFWTDLSENLKPRIQTKFWA